MATEEVFQLNDDGTTVFAFAEISRLVRRPTLEQYRDVLEGLGAMQEALVPDPDADPDTIKASKVTVQFDALLHWFDEMFVALAGEGLPRKTVYRDSLGDVVDPQAPTREGEQLTQEDVIDASKLPSWLIAADIVTDLIKHWQVVPSRRGGR